MKISDFDKNLKVETKLPFNLKWFTPLDAPISLHGIHSYSPERGYMRIPAEIAKKVSPGVDWLSRNTAGGRIRFKTNSRNIAVKVYVTSDGIMPHITATGQSGLDIYTTENHISSYVQSLLPVFQKEDDGFSYETIAYVDGEMHNYTLNMPLYSDVKAIYIGLDEDALLEKAEDYAVKQPVLYYGSSITQGGCASRPGNAYEAVLSRIFDCDFINLGFSGNAKGEPIMAEYLASLDPCVFVLDYDHNAPDPEHLQKTHEPLFRTFRAAHPLTPVVMLSKPDFKPNADCLRRREIVRATFENARDAGDENVYFIDGETLFDGAFRDSCTVDGCHPNDLGFIRMAEKIAVVMKPLIEAVKNSSSVG